MLLTSKVKTNSYRVNFLILFIATFLLLIASSVHAQGRQPCSGSKGGISHCAGATFVCNDGSVSASKKHCSKSAPAHEDGSSISKFSSSGKDSACSCRSGKFCTGPKGGRYCFTDSGNKSYLKR